MVGLPGASCPRANWNRKKWKNGIGKFEEEDEG